MARVSALIDRYRPDVLVMEAAGRNGSRRCARIRELISDLRKLATKKKVATRSFSRRGVRETFADSGAVTKYEIATEITQQFPELGQVLPPPRRLWMPEDKRMAVYTIVNVEEWDIEKPIAREYVTSPAGMAE